MRDPRLISAILDCEKLVVVRRLDQRSIVSSEDGFERRCPDAPNITAGICDVIIYIHFLIARLVVYRYHRGLGFRAAVS